MTYPQYRYTSKEWDTDTGLYFYGARYYNAQIGRFITADPAPVRREDPQSLNRYAYARNNPIFYNDPSGNQFADSAELPKAVSPGGEAPQDAAAGLVCQCEDHGTAGSASSRPPPASPSPPLFSLKLMGMRFGRDTEDAAVAKVPGSDLQLTTGWQEVTPANNPDGLFYAFSALKSVAAWRLSGIVQLPKYLEVPAVVLSGIQSDVLAVQVKVDMQTALFAPWYGEVETHLVLGSPLIRTSVSYEGIGPAERRVTEASVTYRVTNFDSSVFEYGPVRSPLFGSGAPKGTFPLHDRPLK